MGLPSFRDPTTIRQQNASVALVPDRSRLIGQYSARASQIRRGATTCELPTKLVDPVFWNSFSGAGRHPGIKSSPVRWTVQGPSSAAPGDLNPLSPVIACRDATSVYRGTWVRCAGAITSETGGSEIRIR
jgi:hypothetical protein